MSEISRFNTGTEIYDLKDATARQEIAGKQDSLAFDASPTSGSFNPVYSGGVFTSLASKANASDVYSKTETDDKIGAAISSVYKPAGSRTFEDLPTLEASLLGNVYNITNDFTTDSRFIEGTGKPGKAGSNVAVVVQIENGVNTYYFDVLSGLIDTTGFATKAEMNTGLGGKVSGSGMNMSINADGTVRLTYNE